MTNEDAIRGKLSAVVREVEALVRASDMFKSLAVGAADGIEKQAETRKSPADTGSPPPPGTFAREKDALAARVDREAEAQVKFANWLRGLAGEPPKPTP